MIIYYIKEYMDFLLFSFHHVYVVGVFLYIVQGKHQGSPHIRTLIIEYSYVLLSVKVSSNSAGYLDKFIK